MMIALFTLLISQGASAAAPGEAVPAFNAHGFRPTLDLSPTLATSTSALGANKRSTAQALFGYARKPFVFEGADGAVSIDNLMEIDLLGAHVEDPLRIGFGLPIYSASVGGAGESEAGLGDLWLDVKGQILKRKDHVVGAALTARATLPTSTMDLPLGTPKGFIGEAELAVDRRVHDQVLVVVNGGLRSTPDVERENLSWGDQWYWRGAVIGDVSSELRLSLEYTSTHVFGAWDEDFANPAEVLVGGIYAIPDSPWRVRFGGGMGLNNSVGSAGARALVGATWQQAAEKKGKKGKKGKKS